MEMDLRLNLHITRKEKRKIIFCMDTENDLLGAQSEQLTESEMEIAIAFLRDCADAVELELKNKHYKTH